MPEKPLYNLAPKNGYLTTRTTELGNTKASQSLAASTIMSQNDRALEVQQAQQAEAARLKAANDAKIDGALETAAKINLETAGALRPGTFFPLPSAKPTMGPQLTAEYQLVNQEKNRSKQIITQSFAEKDPLSEELNTKIGQVESELIKVKDTAKVQTFGGSSMTPFGAVATSLDTSTKESKELEKQLNQLKQSQAIINQYKAEIQIAKATEDYLLNLKSQGKRLDSETIKPLIDVTKDITAKQRVATRGDELYDPNAYEVYTKQTKGNNDFFDWRHTDLSLANTLNAIDNVIRENPEKAQELVPVLKQVQGFYKNHEKSNKDAYDHFYGTNKQYYKEGRPTSTYAYTQGVMAATEGLYNFFSPFVSATQSALGFHKAAFETKQAKSKYFSGDMLTADLDGDNQITERDTDAFGQYQYIGQNVTYTKKDGSLGFIGSSVLGASVRTLAEMAPTLLITRGLMKAGVGARLSTFAPVAVSSGVRSYEENKKWYKNSGDAAVVSAVQGIIEGATESIVPDIKYFMGNEKLGTKALSSSQRKQFIAQTLIPEYKDLSTAAKNFLSGSYYSGRSFAKQTLQEGVEEEISMFANYVLDKTYKTKDDEVEGKPEELDVSSVGGFFKSVAKTFVESAAAGGLMGVVSIGASRQADRNYMRFNIANNPEAFKAELQTLLQKNEIDKDQYNRSLLEVGRLNQLKEQATSKMMNLVDANTLLQDKDKQYEYFSDLLTRDDLLQKVDYTSLSDEDKVAYAKEVERVEKSIEGYENLAKQYAEMPIEEKENILAKMVQRQLTTVASTNDPATLKQNLEAIDNAIQVGEKTGKGSSVMTTGRQQVRDAVIARMQELTAVEDNGNTVFENQLLSTPVESMGESMQISNAVRLDSLLTQNSKLISPQVRQELTDRISKASIVAQERIKELPKKEQAKVLSRELARVELLHPGTAFNDESLVKLFAREFTPEEKAELIRDTAVTISREKEKIEDEELVPPTEKDPIIDSLIKSFQSQPLEVQVENEMGNLEKTRNEERVTRERRAVMAIPRSKSKDQAKSRVKSIFKAMDIYSPEDINKALEDLNKLFDNQEVTDPGTIYNSYLRFLDPNLLKGLPDKVAPVEDFLEEPVVETPAETKVETPATDSIGTVDSPEVVNQEQEDELFGTNAEIEASRNKDLDLPEVDPADEVTEPEQVVTPAEDEFDGLEVVPVSTIQSPDLVHTTPTVFTSSNAAVQGSIMRTISNSLESYSMKLTDMFSFIRETLGESAISTLENIYNNVTEALKTQNTEALVALKEEFLGVFGGSTFSNEQLEYIWNEQYVKGKPDASIPFQEAKYVSNPQFATAYKGEDVIVNGVNKQTGELFTYKAKVTGNVNESNQIEVITSKGNLVYVKRSNLNPVTAKPISVRADFNQINSVLFTAVDRTSGEVVNFNSNGERDSQGDTQLNVFAPKDNTVMQEVRNSLASGQPVSHTLPIHAGARINNGAAYRKGKNSVYLTASVAGIDSNITVSESPVEEVKEVIPMAPPEVVAEQELRSTQVSLLPTFKTSIENALTRDENLREQISESVQKVKEGDKTGDTRGINSSLSLRGDKIKKAMIALLEETQNMYSSTAANKLLKSILNKAVQNYESTGQKDLTKQVLERKIVEVQKSIDEDTKLSFKSVLMNIPGTGLFNLGDNAGKYDTELAALGKPTSSQFTDVKTEMVKDYLREVITQARNSLSKIRKKLTQVKDSTLIVGKKYVRVQTDQEGNVYKVEIVTGTGKSFEYTFMSGYTGSGNTKATTTNLPIFIDESGKESDMMSPERLGYFFELPALEQPIQPEVTTNLSADELAILSFDASQITGLESTQETIDNNTSEEMENAASCKIN